MVSIRTRTRGGQESQKPTAELKIKALTDFWAFVDLIGFHGGSHNFSKCHRDLVSWSNSSKRSKRQLVLMPRGHLKSTIMTVGRTLWRIYQNPNIRVFVGTSTFSLSKAIIREIKTYLEDEELQESVWNDRPHKSGRLVPTMDRTGNQRRLQDTEATDKKVVWRADALQVIRDDILKEPTVVAGSVGSAATGFHFDEIMFDDVVTFDNIDTETKREKLFNWIYDIESVLDIQQFDQDLYETFHDLTASNYLRGLFKSHCYVGDSVIAVGTKYDPQDYYHHVINHQEALGFDVYEQNIYANGSDNSEGYLWAERFNETVETRLRESMPARRFASQYLNKVIAEGTTILPWDKIQFFTPAAVNTGQQNKCSIRCGEFEWKEITLRCIIDPAATTNYQSDYTCMAVGGVDDKNNFYVVDLWMGKEPFSVWLKEMYKLLDRWNLTCVTIETVGFQKTLVDSIRQQFDNNRPIVIRDYKPPHNQDKKSRIEATLEPLFSNEKIHFAKKIADVKNIQDQFNLFGRPSVHDDAPDAVAILKSLSISSANRVKPFNPTKDRSFNNRYGGFI